MKTVDEITQDVKAIVVEVLAVEPEEVVPSARFFEDLGGESIDVLELSFRCEKSFGVKLQFQEIFSPEDVVTDEDGLLTKKSLSTMKTKFPFLDWSGFETNPMKNRITELFTVGAVAQFVREALIENTAGSGSQARQTSAGMSTA